MKKSQARGYLLEIILSKMIEINGYEAINKPDEPDIVSNPNGLNLKGRGAYHQFDSLGELKATPPFINPRRLFLDAKFYDTKKVGVDKVMMGIGILNDINTSRSTVSIGKRKRTASRHYKYNYALFSTSGFTEEAQLLAMAHKIYLIHLGGDGYIWIMQSINGIVDALDDFGPEKDRVNVEVFDDFRKNFISWLDSNRLEVHYSDFEKLLCNYSSEYLVDFTGENHEVPVKGRNDSSYNERFEKIKPFIDSIIKNLSNKSIYLANSEISQLVPLMPDDNDKFMSALKRNPHQDVIIYFDKEDKYWVVKTPNNSEYNFRLTFKLPSIFAKQIFRHTTNILNTKNNGEYKLTFIAYLDGENPTLCTLKPIDII